MSVSRADRAILDELALEELAARRERAREADNAARLLEGLNALDDVEVEWSWLRGVNGDWSDA